MKQEIESRQISVTEMAPHVHSFLPNENKVIKIADWLESWIKSAIKEKQINYNDYLPSKGDLAFHIGVSLGTMQNAFRILEDKGLIESKQRIGSVIKNPKKQKSEKLTSKREVASQLIKNYLKENDYKVGDILISTRKLADILGISFSTIRTSINLLIAEDIIIAKNKAFIVNSMNFDVDNLEQKSLAEKIAEQINQYIKKHLKQGKKLPSNNAFADMFSVSVKTVHDAIKILSLARIVKTRRGYYGTTVCNINENNDDMYYYEQVEQGIKQYIAENCKIGDKLPTIKNFAEVFNISAKTIKNALDGLANEGYVNFVRGKYGGTFVTEIPSIYKQGYTWLALSSEFQQMN